MGARRPAAVVRALGPYRRAESRRCCGVDHRRRILPARHHRAVHRAVPAARARCEFTISRAVLGASVRHERQGKRHVQPRHRRGARLDEVRADYHRLRLRAGCPARHPRRLRGALDRLCAAAIERGMDRLPATDPRADLPDGVRSRSAERFDRHRDRRDLRQFAHPACRRDHRETEGLRAGGARDGRDGRPHLLSTHRSERHAVHPRRRQRRLCRRP